MCPIYLFLIFSSLNTINDIKYVPTIVINRIIVEIHERSFCTDKKRHKVNGYDSFLKSIKKLYKNMNDKLYEKKKELIKDELNYEKFSNLVEETKKLMKNIMDQLYEIITSQLNLFHSKDQSKCINTSDYVFKTSDKEIIQEIEEKILQIESVVETIEEKDSFKCFLDKISNEFNFGSFISEWCAGFYGIKAEKRVVSKKLQSVRHKDGTDFYSNSENSEESHKIRFYSEYIRSPHALETYLNISQIESSEMESNNSEMKSNYGELILTEPEHKKLKIDQDLIRDDELVEKNDEWCFKVEQKHVFNDFSCTISSYLYDFINEIDTYIIYIQDLTNTEKKYSCKQSNVEKPCRILFEVAKNKNVSSEINLEKSLYFIRNSIHKFSPADGKTFQINIFLDWHYIEDIICETFNDYNNDDISYQVQDYLCDVIEFSIYTKLGPIVEFLESISKKEYEVYVNFMFDYYGLPENYIKSVFELSDSVNSKICKFWLAKGRYFILIRTLILLYIEKFHIKLQRKI